jgi:hypothetical protein
MNPTNARKKRELGIDAGTATSRLKKMVLFDLLCRHNENICFHCKGRIEAVDSLSLEHKKPWLGVDVALFWDMGNIAFSHLKCNIKAARRDAPALKRRLAEKSPFPRKVGKEGTAWCRSHKDFLPVDEFGKNASQWNGLQGECRACRSRHPSRSKVERVAGFEPALSGWKPEALPLGDTRMV